MMNIREKRQEYSNLCNQLDEYIKIMNPCNIKVIKIGGIDTITCARYIHGNKEGLLCCAGTEGYHRNDIFESDCKHHCKNGCRVKSLSCKLWFCESAWIHLIYKYNRINPGEFNLLKDFIEMIQTANQMCRLFDIPAKSRFSMNENFKSLK